MPFTLAHPAAAVPLRRVLGRHAVLSALVIGSMAPDFWYVLPLPLKRADTHSLAGFFWFCLPAGLLVYLAYHTLMKEPWLELLPRTLTERLAGCGAATRGLPRASWLAVIASLAAGTMTHLAWDAITHDGMVVGHALSALDVPLFSIGSYHAHGYSLLQHLSTLAGLALLAMWARAWFRHAAIHDPAPRRLSRGGAVAVLCAIAAAIASIFFGTLAVALDQRPGLVETRLLAKAAFGQAGAVAVLALFVYGIAWHALGLLSHRRAR